MNITLILFLIGILGFVLNRKNIILMLISIEIMLLAITFLILVSSLNMDDIIGQTYAIYIIVIAGAESAIGLGILVAFYRLNSSPVKNPRLNLTYSPFNLATTFYSSVPRISSLIQASGFLVRKSELRSERSINYSSERKIESLCLNPSFISGFSDAEGSFVVVILKNPRYKTG
jgi:NADH-ubiquinone oxidoreductase chain 4L